MSRYPHAETTSHGASLSLLAHTERRRGRVHWQIITSLTLTNPVPNVTVALSGAVPDPSTGKVTLSAFHPSNSRSG